MNYPNGGIWNPYYGYGDMGTRIEVSALLQHGPAQLTVTSEDAVEPEDGPVLGHLVVHAPPTVPGGRRSPRSREAFKH